ncbi:Thiol:disulfide interchange protein DsbD precursor [Anatilimnocola aggregata]|uniref:Thiol:disulfide interchange protein DsbD n=1 Tax=Anatilimnocola aggregata TaxID=2528021 RepID=A0A517YD12_9BACT|nr:thioredoxin family protein [Anatilimnocola aggregata]QDU28012.1 Thiol:disulfide interchange protein DsbD precursor [Anatilimnocola aggregata]
MRRCVGKSGQLILASAWLLVGLLGTVVVAQEAPTKTKAKPFNFDFAPNPGLSPAAASGEMELTASFHIEQGASTGRLVVEATISPEWHTFAITQPPGGSQPSKLTVPAAVDYRLTGPWVADRNPKVVASEVFQHKGKPVQEEMFEGRVVWTAPIELTAGVKAEELEIPVAYSGQICHDKGGCIPVNKPKLVAKFAGYDEAPQTAGEFKAYDGELVLRGKLEPQVVKPGGTATLTITAEVAPEWHVYEQANAIGESINKPTLFVVANSAGWKVGEVKASAPAKAPSGSSDLPYYSGTVSWVVDLQVPADAPRGEVTLSGLLGFQICTDTNCKTPAGAQFTVSAIVGEADSVGPALVQFKEGTYKEAAELTKEMAASTAAQTATTEGRATAAPLPMPLLIGLAFAGGLLLNFMPCVLPVLGLKLISFAQQGGESRTRMLLLNLSYTAGLMVVFMILAVLSITAGLAWGEQMTHFGFRMTLLVITFALALSLFGVWEIPIPGFAGSEGSSKLQKQEGYTGAFFKGLFTTILGISCSGPLLGFALGATISLPPIYTVVIFACIGLGMASPFLALPFVPGVRNLLPKPGDWMDTFKQVMGFVMMAAAIFFFSTIQNEWRIATASLLLGVGFACWWIGKVPMYDPLGKQLTAWIGGAAAAALVGVVAFNTLGPPDKSVALDWQEFSTAKLKQLQQENRTILVDFTADWCVNCQTNLKFAIERSDVKQLVEQNKVVAVKADWTNPNPELEATLKGLRMRQIPVLAIYPAGKPEDVIVIDGILTKDQVIAAIQKAGPSKVALDNARPAAATTAKLDLSTP